tara:strand:- start:1026 stop:1457 length:432 start_codon:yes stop_codon:yes gene_type:complete
MAEDLTIDISKLDDEICSQPQHFYSASIGVANATSARDKAKDDLSRFDSDTYIKLKSEYADDGKKVTEAHLTNEVQGHVNRPIEELRQAEEDLAEAIAKRDALHQRASMLKALVELVVSNHYTTDSYGDNRKAVAAARKKLTE